MKLEFIESKECYTQEGYIVAMDFRAQHVDLDSFSIAPALWRASFWIFLAMSASRIF